MNETTPHHNAPFFGLGFDMRPVVARAMSLTCVHAAPCCVSVSPLPDAEEFFLWGYGLMVALSREIRAG